MAKRILLADDSITIQKVVELTFSDGDYEVVSVNNGAKAIQKLAEMRPDIILSDIIMPEKNGYEVCEFVKSHPDYRTIPVILLTGTFEPFDPDRAEKAGCDAVVTKPFESQSLIHKVEELIQASKPSAPAGGGSSQFSTGQTPAAAWPPADLNPPEPLPPPPRASGSETPFAPAESPFDGTGGASLLRRGGTAPAPPPQEHGADIFGAAGRTAASPPSGGAAAPPSNFSGETRAFPKTSFDDLPPAGGLPTPAQKETSPWDAPEPEPPAFSGETKAFPRMNFDDLQKMSDFSSKPAEAKKDQSPWGASSESAPPSGETRAFPRKSFDDLQKAAAPPPPPQQEEPSPWDTAPEPPPSTPSGETRAFPQLGMDEMQRMSPPSASSWDSSTESVWGAGSGSAPEARPAAGSSSFSDSASRDDAFGSSPSASGEKESGAAAWSSQADSGPSKSGEAAPETRLGGDLTEDQIDKIARRVVQLMSEQVIKNIAWEVIPDMAEMVVKERIRQLEGE
jgi:CheY-like chemotaxis protein